MIDENKYYKMMYIFLDCVYPEQLKNYPGKMFNNILAIFSI